MADLSVDLCGHYLPNPLVLASGPLTWNAKAIQAAFAAGAAAAVTKTIRPRATVNPVPHYFFDQRCLVGERCDHVILFHAIGLCRSGDVMQVKVRHR